MLWMKQDVKARLFMTVSYHATQMLANDTRMVSIYITGVGSLEISSFLRILLSSELLFLRHTNSFPSLGPSPGPSFP